MVNYKVRTFCEPEIDSVGAEVQIYSSEEEKIDTILITTESQYNALVARLDSMDEDYIDREELMELLQNAQENNLNIDATTFNGLTSEQYAKANHNELHTNFFAPIDHALETNRYGLGSNSKYGHVKTINNLDTVNFVNGEALSAYQGNVLKSMIENLSKPISTVKNANNMATNRFSSWSKITFEKRGNLVVMDYNLGCSSNQTLGTTLNICTVPTSFIPNNLDVQSTWNYVDSSGKIFFEKNDDILHVKFHIFSSSTNKKPIMRGQLVYYTG